MMKAESELEIPKVKVATEPWVLEQLMDTERRFEKSFNRQMEYLARQQDAANARFDQQSDKLSQALIQLQNSTNTRIDRMIWAVVAIGVAVIATLFIRPNI